MIPLIVIVAVVLIVTALSLVMARGDDSETSDLDIRELARAELRLYELRRQREAYVLKAELHRDASRTRREIDSELRDVGEAP